MAATLGTIVVGLTVLVVGYRMGDVAGLFVMAGGGLVVSLGVRMLFDLHGATGPDANRPSEFIDGMSYDCSQTLDSLDPRR